VGGPRLYDLLNKLPLDEFGVLAWVILDREEEIFDIDNVRDEDKVMQALWFRWIFLNRYVQLKVKFLHMSTGRQEQIRRGIFQWNEDVHQRELADDRSSCWSCRFKDMASRTYGYM
jgi:hypothetical protein